MRKIYILLCISLLSLGNLAVAQTKSVSGVILDEEGLPLAGLTVFEKGTTNGVASDSEGRFTLNLQKEPSESILVFSSVGYKEQEISANNISDNFTLRMEVDTKALDEVVVVAYGIQTKQSLTGSVATVKSDVISRQLQPVALNALQGAVAGVNLITSGGQPGDTPAIRIRGFGGINTSQEPLIILDGSPYYGNLSSISAEQIESFSVLKDASATALYGSRASSGVILITTKAGANEEGTIKISSRYGQSYLGTPPPPLVDSKTYYEYMWEAIRNSRLDLNSTLPPDAAAQYATDYLISRLGYNSTNVANPVGIDGKFDPNASLYWETDWLRAILRDRATYTENSASFSGQARKTNYFVNVDYINQNGLISNSNFNRYTLRLNLSTEIKKWLKFGTNTSYASAFRNSPLQSGTFYSNVMLWNYSVPSIYPIYRRDANGGYILDNNGERQYDYGNYGNGINERRPLIPGENPLGSLFNDKDGYTNVDFYTTNFLNFNIWKGLEFNTRLGYQYSPNDEKEYYYNKAGLARSVNGRVIQRRYITQSYTFTNTLSYKTVVGKHAIGGKVLAEAYQYKYDYLRAQGTGFLTGVYALAGSTTPENVYGYIDQERILSYMGQVEYSFNEKYYVDASFRMDGSSRFDKENRFGKFYSVGGSWIISEERFLKRFSSYISLLKLRLSYGSVGNNRTVDTIFPYPQIYFPYLQTYNAGWSNGDAAGVLLGKVADKRLSWETTHIANFALDFGFFKDQLSGSVEYYIKESDGLLFDVPLPGSTGNTSIMRNLGDIKNTGVEVTLNVKLVKSKDFLADLNLNLSTLTNKFTKLPQEKITSGNKQYMVGRSIYDFFLREYADVNPDNGQMRWWKDVTDSQGNPVTDAEGNILREKTNNYSAATQYYSGSSIPKFFGGFGLTLSWKGISMTSQFNYSVGGKIMDYQYANLIGNFSSISPVATYVAGRWQKPGDITDIPKFTTAQTDSFYESTRYLFENNYLRLKNMTIGYDLNKKWVSKLRLENVNINISAQNLWTWQSHKGIDPEQSFNGNTNYRSFIMKTYSLGINIKL